MCDVLIKFLGWPLLQSKSGIGRITVVPPFKGENLASFASFICLACDSNRCTETYISVWYNYEILFAFPPHYYSSNSPVVGWEVWASVISLVSVTSCVWDDEGCNCTSDRTSPQPVIWTKLPRMFF